MKHLRVHDLPSLANVASWARRLPLFDAADQNGGAVEITLAGRTIGRIMCATAAFGYSAEQICTSVAIRREFAGPLFALAA